MMSREKRPDRPVEALGVDSCGVHMAAAHLDEGFLAARGLIQPAPLRNRDHRVFRTVQEQHGRPDAIDLLDGLEPIAHQQANGKQRVALPVDVDKRCRRPLEDDGGFFNF